MRFVGVDGCPDGWLAVCYEDDQFDHASQYETIEAVWDAYEDVQTILVDVPIGLREDSNEPRKCDTASRQKLSPLRHTSVFPVPVRSATRCEDYESAKREQEEKTGGSLGTQTWAISGKIGEVDSILLEDPDARTTIREAHPEVCFWALNGDEPMRHSKSRRPLMAFWERVEALERVQQDVLGTVRTAALELDTEADNSDLLDAFVLAVTASPLTDDLQTLPPKPEEDPEGLPMEMVYARPYEERLIPSQLGKAETEYQHN